MLDALGNPQRALILGGSSDIALATVRLMAARRLEHVVLAGRDVPGLERHAQSLGAPGLRAEAERLDVLTDDPEEWVKKQFSRAGGFDLVLLAVGQLGDQDALEHDSQGTRQLLETNFTALAALALSAARLLERQGQGVLLVLSSVAGQVPRRSNFIYGSSKAGLDFFAQGLQEAFRGTGVSIVIVRPGFVRTRMTAGRTPSPLSRDPSDVAEAILGALQSRRGVVYVPTVLGPIFALLRCLPRAVLRRLPFA